MKPVPAKSGLLVVAAAVVVAVTAAVAVGVAAAVIVVVAAAENVVAVAVAAAVIVDRPSPPGADLSQGRAKIILYTNLPGFNTPCGSRHFFTRR